MEVVLVIIALLVILAAVVLVRTAAFKPAQTTQVQPDEVVTDDAKIISDMQQFIRCKTVSNRDPALAAPMAEFDKFRDLLKTLFPSVHEKCTLERIGPSGLLYHLKGESNENPSVFMSHYDVVPANEEAWQKPAFEGIIEEGVLWGRGTLDTKGTLLGVMESAEALLKDGFVPKNDIYFSFSGDEEIAGESAPSIVSELEKRGITPAFVLDEGGAVVEDVFPGVSSPCALIGTGEKGMMDLELLAESGGGHASAPPPHTLVGELSAACVAIENKPFKMNLTQPAAEMFDTLGRHSSFAYRMIFSNLWLFKPVLDSLCKKKGGELNALMRTTAAFTVMEGSKGTNVLPPRAKMVANLRLIGGDTTDSAIARINGIIGNDKIKLNMIHGMNPSPFSSTDCEGWEKLSNAIRSTWTEALVSPYLMVACSDSRHFCRISDKVYRFSAMALSKEERACIHGNDERISTDKLVTTVKFYTRLMRTM